MPETPLADTMRNLAETFPHRFIWFPEHEVLRISVDGQHRTTGPCMDAWVKYPLHLGMVEAALREECRALGFHWKVYPAAYRPAPYGAEVGDWDRLRWEGNASSPAEALALALLGAWDVLRPTPTPPASIDVPTSYPAGTRVTWCEGRSGRQRIGTVEAIHQQPGWPAEYDVRVLRQNGTPGKAFQRRHHSELTLEGS